MARGKLQTATDWEACTDPAPMWTILSKRIDNRKHRLVACAAARHAWHLLAEPFHAAIEAVERHADGESGPAELQASMVSVRDALDQVCRSVSGKIGTMTAARQLAPVWAVRFAIEPDHEGRYWGGAKMAMERICMLAPRAETYPWQCAVLRDLFGNPFQPPLMLDPAWLRWHDGTIPRLAQRMYDSRDFAAMPILADALEEAGCTNGDILEHCRGPGPHVRGCFVVDLILGKV